MSSDDDSDQILSTKILEIKVENNSGGFELSN